MILSAIRSALLLAAAGWQDISVWICLLLSASFVLHRVFRNVQSGRRQGPGSGCQSCGGCVNHQLRAAPSEFVQLGGGRS